ncbi:MAG: hypothetical protein VKI42_05520, partial [Synechococcaceae cyanobacterium]|nr:hypothetical protein [Synechococcaceae cyanobacterium]
MNASARLRSQGRESATEYGRALFSASAERLSVALGVLLEELLANPHRAGKHLSAWPLLLLVPRGPRSLAMVALSVVIDSISQRRPDKEMARAIGDALLDEVRARRVEERGTALMRLVRRRLGAKRLASRQVLESLHLDTSTWDLAQRREIGMLLLELIESATGLIEFRTIKTRGIARRMVGPTPDALAVIRANPPRPTPIRQLPLLVRPLPWDGMTGGGNPGSAEPLVRTRAGMDLGYLSAEALRPVTSAANFLQAQGVMIDPWMVSQQQRAWDHNIPGLFSTTRDGAPDPPMPEAIVGPEAWRAYRRDLATARRDRLEGSTARRRIETSLRQAEEVAGMPIWFSYCADFRGRLYTANRYATHQGPDHEKAAVQ